MLTYYQTTISDKYQVTLNVLLYKTVKEDLGNLGLSQVPPFITRVSNIHEVYSSFLLEREISVKTVWTAHAALKHVLIVANSV